MTLPLSASIAISSLISVIPSIQYKDGGCFSYKVTNKHVKETWRDLSFLFQGKMISENKDFVNDINGISISPKKIFVLLNFG